MNIEMAYLLGMICGNGTVQRSNVSTTISIAIPHKKLETEDFHDIKLYVKASINDIRNILEPLLGSGIQTTQDKNVSTISFILPNADYTNREIMRLINGATTRENMRIHEEIFNSTYDERRYFMRGFADVTGYIRRSNYFFEKYKHRVYLEIPNNWEMVIDVANLLRTLDVPIQNIDWAHPNMRDGNLKKYNEGKVDFWKKEHQIKIWANEFEVIGFGVMHKDSALEMYANELRRGFEDNGEDIGSTHRYYWEGKTIRKSKPIHPGEKDSIIPQKIRGVHFESWKDIAEALGYGKECK